MVVVAVMMMMMALSVMILELALVMTVMVVVRMVIQLLLTVNSRVRPYKLCSVGKTAPISLEIGTHSF